jgi:metal-dependent amidase/aminoacylase/carboxypeptidase family protein
LLEESMMESGNKRVVSRRLLLGGAAGGVMGGCLAPAVAAHAGSGSAPTTAGTGAVHEVASRLDRHLIELRRDIHRHPETAGHEQRTAGVVAQQLRAAGLAVTTGIGGYGVVGILTGARPGRTVAYRADMDAVPADEQIKGGGEAAHVCGHDIHTAVGVGAALVLARLRERLSGTVMFVFQPAEESLTGAAAMLADGVFTRARPAEIHALHCGPFPVGQLLVTPGTGLPGQDRGVVTLTGPDAVVRARRLATRINGLGTVSPPATSAELEQLVADLQTPHGPLARSVFMQTRVSEAPDRVEVQLSYRCWPENRHAAIRETIRRFARHVGAASVSFPRDPLPAMVTPRAEGRALKRYLDRTVGPDRARTVHAAVPFSGEDFALFLDRIPGTYTFLGVRAPDAAIETSYPHYGAFNPDERAIGHGVRAMAGWLATRTQA